MKAYLKKIETLEQLDIFLKEENRIVIYGIGEYGQCLVDYVKSWNKNVHIQGIVVTDTKHAIKEYKGIKVNDVDQFLKKCKEVSVIIAISSLLHAQLSEIVEKYTQDYVCVTDRLFYRMNTKIEKKFMPIKKIDFCFAGFPKCGTTSIYGELLEQDSVYLPDGKATQFFNWYKKMVNPESFLEKKYFSGVKEKQVVGMIEAFFFKYPKEVKQLLGDEVKIVFVLRNPIKAIFSLFKMQTRTGGYGEVLEELYDKRYSCEDMFTDYLNKISSKQLLTPMHYFFWIEQFYKIYSKEQIKIIFFEELINNPKSVMNEVFSFVGIINEYNNDNLMHWNRGDYAMAEKEGYLLGREKRMVSRDICTTNDINERAMLERKILRIDEKYNDIPKVYGLQMTEYQKEIAKKIFDEDVRELTKIVDVDLLSLWEWNEG